MAAILDKIFELIKAWIAYLIPWHVLGDDEVGLIRRVGCFHRYMRHGFNWKWPVLETPCFVTSALDSTVLREQSLTTADNVQVTLRGVITYRVVEARKYILDCATTISVVNDVGCCVIAEMVPTMQSNEVLMGEGFNAQLLRKVKIRAKKWGIEVDSVGVIDRVNAPVYRLISTAGRESIDIGVPQ